ncbi:hypothetical protein Bca4012_058634 [Brassica carinata]
MARVEVTAAPSPDPMSILLDRPCRGLFQGVVSGFRTVAPLGVLVGRSLLSGIVFKGLRRVSCRIWPVRCDSDDFFLILSSSARSCVPPRVGLLTFEAILLPVLGMAGSEVDTSSAGLRVGVFSCWSLRATPVSVSAVFSDASSCFSIEVFSVLGLAIIFKSGSPGRLKLPGSRLSVELC